MFDLLLWVSCAIMDMISSGIQTILGAVLIVMSIAIPAGIIILAIWNACMGGEN